MTKPLPTLIILDLDDTLYEYQPANRAGMDQAALVLKNQLGLVEKDWLPLFHEARSEVKNRLGENASSHSRLLYFKTLLEKLGVGGHLDLALQMETQFWQSFMRSMAPTYGSIEFLELCRSLGIPVVIMTDLTLQVQIRKLINLNLLNLVHALISSEETGEDKPSRRFLNYAQQSLGLNTSHVWVIGDDEVKDGGLAKTAGGIFFHVTPAKVYRNGFDRLTQKLQVLAE